MRKWYLIYFLIIIVSGCSTKPISIAQKYDGLVVELSKKTENQFRLVDRYGTVISTSYGNNGFIQFGIPNNVSGNQCFYVLDQKGKLFLEKGVQLSLINNFRYLIDRKNVFENQVRDNIKKENKYKQLLNSTDSKLNGNRAFNGTSCSLPATKPLPREPITKCKYESECKEEGAAICYTRHIGVYGCNIALNNIGASSILSSPFCAERAATLANEKYDMDNFVVDLLWGVADSVAEKYKKSKSWEDNAWGWAIQIASTALKINAAVSCTDDFVEQNYGPRRRWLNYKYDIESEPKRTKDACVNFIHEYNGHHKKVGQHHNEHIAIEKKIVSLNRQIEEMRKVSKSVVSCKQR